MEDKCWNFDIVLGKATDIMKLMKIALDIEAKKLFIHVNDIVTFYYQNRDCHRVDIQGDVDINTSCIYGIEVKEYFVSVYIDELVAIIKSTSAKKVLRLIKYIGDDELTVIVGDKESKLLILDNMISFSPIVQNAHRELKCGMDFLINCFNEIKKRGLQDVVLSFGLGTFVVTSISEEGDTVDINRIDKQNSKVNISSMISYPYKLDQLKNLKLLNSMMLKRMFINIDDNNKVTIDIIGRDNTTFMYTIYIDQNINIFDD